MLIILWKGEQFEWKRAAFMKESKCAGTEFTGWILSFTYHERSKNLPPQKTNSKQTKPTCLYKDL